MRIRLLVAGLALVGAGVATPLVLQRAGEPRRPEPLLVSLDGSPINITAKTDGVWFDVDGDGTKDLTPWTEAGAAVAFVAIDENGNGTIDDGTELVGVVSGPPNGIAYLRALDGYASLSSPKGAQRTPDGQIDRADGVFENLVLWTDLNHNGQSEEQEMQSLAYAGFRVLDIRSVQVLDVSDGRGNLLRTRSLAVQAKGSAMLNRELVTVRLGG